MRYLKIGLLLGLFLSSQVFAWDTEPTLSTPHQSQQESDYQIEGTLNLGMWNMLWFPGRKSENAKPEVVDEHIQMMGEYVRSKNLDIFFACEVKDIASLEAMKAGYTSYACTEVEDNFGRQNQGLALMSKVPWEEVWWIDFSKMEPNTDRPVRGILGAKFKMGKKVLYLYGVHLKSNRDAAEGVISNREKAMEYLIQDIQKRKLDLKKDWVVVLGDFNTTHDAPYQKETTLTKLDNLGFTEVKKGMSPEQSVTVPKRKKSKFAAVEFDRIYFSPALAQQMKTPPPWGIVHRATWKHSDHRMVSVDVPLK